MPTGKNNMTYGYTQNTWLESHGTHIHFHAKHRWPQYFLCPGIGTCVHHIHLWCLLSLPAVP